MFSVYLRSLAARDIGYWVFDDGQHVLNITADVGLYIRPETTDLAATVASLRKLAEAATAMAGVLEGQAGGTPGMPAVSGEAPEGDGDGNRDDGAYDGHRDGGAS